MTFKHLAFDEYGRDELPLIRVYLRDMVLLQTRMSRSSSLSLTLNVVDLREGGFHRKNQRPAEFGRRRLANGALQYRNIRYWAADSCF